MLDRQSLADYLYDTGTLPNTLETGICIRVFLCVSVCICVGAVVGAEAMAVATIVARRVAGTTMIVVGINLAQRIA